MFMFRIIYIYLFPNSRLLLTSKWALEGQAAMHYEKEMETGFMEVTRHIGPVTSHSEISGLRLWGWGYKSPLIIHTDTVLIIQTL